MGTSFREIADKKYLNKENAERIFNLLPQNIGNIKEGSNILLAFLGHPKYYKLALERFPNCKISILEDISLKQGYDFCSYIPKSDIIYIDFNDKKYLYYIENLYKLNMGFKDKKFDIVVGNPPYGKDSLGSNKKLHFNILKCCNEKLLNDNGKLVFIMPISTYICGSRKDNRDYLKQNNCINIEIINNTNDLFKTNMMPVAIYTLDKSQNTYDSKLDFKFSNIPEINNLFKTKNELNVKRIRKDEVNKDIDSFTHFIKEKYSFDWYLIVNAANGGMNGTYFSSIINDLEIFTGDEIIDFFQKDWKTKKLIGSNNKEYLIGLQNALKRPLLRYILYLCQESQGIPYDYIPDIDYSKITSDEDILNELGIDVKILDFINECKFESGKFIEERNREWKR